MNCSRRIKDLGRGRLDRAEIFIRNDSIDLMTEDGAMIKHNPITGELLHTNGQGKFTVREKSMVRLQLLGIFPPIYSEMMSFLVEKTEVRFCGSGGQAVAKVVRFDNKTVAIVRLKDGAVMTPECEPWGEGKEEIKNFVLRELAKILR